MGFSLEAEQNIGRALQGETSLDATAVVLAVVANAQATLKLAEETRGLVEQQRVANLIAWQASMPRVIDATDLPIEVVEQYAEVAAFADPIIREGLGLS